MILVALLLGLCLALMSAVSAEGVLLALLLGPLLLFPGYLGTIAWRAWRRPDPSSDAVATIAGAIGAVAGASLWIGMASHVLAVLLPSMLPVHGYWLALSLLALAALAGTCLRRPRQDARASRSTPSCALRTAAAIANPLIAAAAVAGAVVATIA